MTKEAKKAAKIEKKLKVLLGGYQSRAEQLKKQTNDLVEQVEQTSLELVTFSILKDHEEMAINKRIEVKYFNKIILICRFTNLVIVQSLSDDVKRQNVREKSLQEKYDELIRKKDALLDQMNKLDIESNDKTGE